jgi:hypothetical protein
VLINLAVLFEVHKGNLHLFLWLNVDFERQEFKYQSFLTLERGEGE